LRQAIAATSADQIAAAALLTVVSFLALTGYDGLALRQLNARVRYKTTALASFTSYAISFTLGFPLITAGTVRYWIYSQAGLTASKGREPHRDRRCDVLVRHGFRAWRGVCVSRQRDQQDQSFLSFDQHADRACRAGRDPRLFGLGDDLPPRCLY
jgi:hypothetical protein